MIDMLEKYPLVKYPVDGFTKEISDIAIGEVVLRNKIDSSYVIWKRELLDGDSPVSVSDQIYGIVDYYWTLLYVNNIVNPFTEWYMGQTEHELYVDSKYKNLGGKEGIHHFINTSAEGRNRQIDDVLYKHYYTQYEQGIPLPFYIKPISNLIYEKEINDTRKTINIISPKFITQFVDTFFQLIEAHA